MKAQTLVVEKTYEKKDPNRTHDRAIHTHGEPQNYC